MAARRRQEGHREHVGSRQQILLDCTGRSSSGSLADTVFSVASRQQRPLPAANQVPELSCSSSWKLRRERPAFSSSWSRSRSLRRHQPSRDAVKVSRTSQPVFSFRSRQTVESCLTPLRSPVVANSAEADISAPSLSGVAASATAQHTQRSAAGRSTVRPSTRSSTRPSRFLLVQSSQT